MPYEIRDENGRYCVHQAETGDLIGCHDSRETAEAQITAVEISESSEKSTTEHYTHASLMAYGDTVKAISGDGGLVVQGRMIKFTDDSQRDLDGEYFNEQTDTYKNVHPLVGKPVLYQHGLDDDIQVIPVGQITEADYKQDGIYIKANINLRKNYEEYIKGLNKPDEWMQAQLAIADDYEERLRYLIESGKLGWSSGALPQSYKSENGHIKSWAVIEVSLTPSPAMPIETAVTPVKSLNPVLLRSLSIDGQMDKPITHDGTSDKSNTINTQSIDNLNHKEQTMFENTPINMSGEELLDMLANFVADARAMMDEMADDDKAYDEDMARMAEDEAKMELERDDEMKAIIASGDKALVKTFGQKRAISAFTRALKTHMETARQDREDAKRAMKAEMDAFKAD
ncbi:MAG: hypothetical protein HRU12_12615, partial [Phaeodactylibacter sp.]|nr:hypothetical protein [Phaeodactylibacter sp.]